MTCLKFCQLLIEAILLARRRLLRHYHNFAIPSDLDASYIHTSRRDGFDRSCHILLPER
jgi:hypothetical protein